MNALYDLVVKVGNDAIFAHKAIIAVKSPMYMATRVVMRIGTRTVCSAQVL